MHALHGIDTGDGPRVPERLIGSLVVEGRIEANVKGQIGEAENDILNLKVGAVGVEGRDSEIGDIVNIDADRSGGAGVLAVGEAVGEAVRADVAVIGLVIEA